MKVLARLGVRPGAGCDVERITPQASLRVQHPVDVSPEPILADKMAALVQWHAAPVEPVARHELHPAFARLRTTCVSAEDLQAKPSQCWV